MYFLALQTQYGYDSVIVSIVKGVKPGDIVHDVQNIYLCIGEDSSFPELYSTQKPYTFQTPQILARKLLNEKTLQIIHWMVKQYFSSYKAVVALFLPWNENFLQKRLAEQRTTKKNAKELSPQFCYIYPNLRTLTQQNKQIDENNTIILHGGMSLIQKQKTFLQVQAGQIQTLLATNRGLFFDRQNLQEIHILDENNRSYSSQSDPRFVLNETAEYIASIHGAKLYL